MREFKRLTEEEPNEPAIICSNKRTELVKIIDDVVRSKKYIVNEFIYNKDGSVKRGPLLAFVHGKAGPGSTHTDPNAIAILENPNEALKDNIYFAFSPALTSCISIELGRHEKVFCIVYPRSAGYLAILQMVERARAMPGRTVTVYLGVEETKSYGVTDASVVKEALQARNDYYMNIKDFQNIDLRAPMDDPLNNLLIELHCDNVASDNDLYGCLTSKIKEMGYKCEKFVPEIDPDQMVFSDIASNREENRKRKEKEESDIAEAPNMNRREYENLNSKSRSGSNITDKEHAMLDKYKLELIFGKNSVTKENALKLKSSLDVVCTYLTCTDAEKYDKETIQSCVPLKSTNYILAKDISFQIMRDIGFKSLEDIETTILSTDLDNKINVLKEKLDKDVKMQNLIRGLLPKINFYNFGKQQVKDILKECGVKLLTDHSIRVNGKVTRVYSLKPQRPDLVLADVNKVKPIKKVKSIHEQYGVTSRKVGKPVNKNV